MSEQTTSDGLLALVAEIVVAYVRHNNLGAADVPSVIRSVHGAFSKLGSDQQQEAERVPAVPIKKSVFPDYLVCLEDGRKFKMLKRHLANAYGLTPEAYRERWGLPQTYPMVAANYAQHRSTLAKDIGLGRKMVEDSETPVPVQRIAEGVRGKRAVKKLKEERPVG